jgi:hypothetical protein
MERIVLTPEEQTTVDAFKERYPYLDPDGLIYEGSNLVVDDNLRVDDQWDCWVLGGEGGLVWSYVPAWALTLPIDLVPYVTDRIGPAGETMPIFDPLEATPHDSECEPLITALLAQRAPRRPFAEALRDAVRRLPEHEQRHCLKVLAKLLERPRPHRYPHPRGPCE